jgi:REP element-mobilizing transposase RayT
MSTAWKRGAGLMLATEALLTDNCSVPVSLFTFHAFRSWRLDHPRGYVQRGQVGVQPPQPRLAAHREGRATRPAIEFSEVQRQCLINAAIEIAARRAWIVHAIAVTASHVHVLLRWEDQAADRQVRDTLKRLLGLALSCEAGSTGHRWFSRGSDVTFVNDQDHFDRLISEYLPQHVKQGGVFWRWKD